MLEGVNDKDNNHLPTSQLHHVMFKIHVCSHAAQGAPAVVIVAMVAEVLGLR